MTESQTYNAQEPQGQQKGSWQLKAILLVSFVPLVAAYVAFYTGWGVPEGTVNKGLMIEPAVDLKPLLLLEDGTPMSIENKPVWRFIVPVGAECNQACENNFYITRQVDIRLGEKSLRVERVALNVGGAEGSKYLASIAKDHPKLTVINVEQASWQQWLGTGQLMAPKSDAHYYYLMDPQGLVMMQYSERNTGNELLKDVKRILRFSPEEQ